MLYFPLLENVNELILQTSITKPALYSMFFSLAIVYKNEKCYSLLTLNDKQSLLILAPECTHNDYLFMIIQYFIFILTL
jgi:hypothetical protein